MHDFRKDRWADTVENFPHKQLTKSVSTRFVFSGWETLPKEILLQVFSDAHPDCSPNARLVCKWWKQNHDSALLELRPVRLDLASLPSLFPNTTSLDTSRTFGRVWPSLDCHDALVQVRRSLLDLTRLSKLRELDLSGAGSLTYKGSSMGIDWSAAMRPAPATPPRRGFLLLEVLRICHSCRMQRLGRAPLPRGRHAVAATYLREEA